jgi:hypothetical protein
VSQTATSFAQFSGQLFAHHANPSAPELGAGASYAHSINAMPEMEPARSRQGKPARKTGEHSVS